MKNILILLSFNFMLLTSFSQDYHKIDSLKQILKTLPELDGTNADTARMKISMLIGKRFEKYIPDSAMFYYQKAIDTSIFSDETVFRKAVNTFKGKHDLNANSMYLLGLLYVYRGDYPVSKNLWSKSELIFEALNDVQSVSKCLNGLSNIAWNQGDYPDAVRHLEKSLKIKQEINDTSGIPYALNNLGLIVMYQGNYQKASEYFENAITLAEKLKDKKILSSSLSNLGIVSSYQGDYKKTITYYERSLAIAEEIRDKRLISNNLGSIGSCFYQTGDLDIAGDYQLRALKIKEELKDRKGIANCYKNIGNIAFRKKDYQSAIDFYIKSIKIKEELGSMADLAADLPVLAKFYIMTDSADKALDPLIKSNEISTLLLKNNFTILGENEKELFLNQTQKVYNDLLAFNTLYHKNDSITGVCYNNELMLKGLLLKSSTAVINTVFNSSDSEIKEAYILMKQYRNQISAMLSSGMPVNEQDISLLENKADEQELKLVKLSSVFAGIDKLFEYNWKDLQRNLKQDEAAVEFVSFTSGVNEDTVMYAALIVTREGKEPATVKLFFDYELERIIGKNTRTGFAYVNSLYDTNSTVLYNLIWEPLEQVLSDIKTVYYAPVGVLNKISFAALAKEPGILLCDIYNLHQLSTTGKLISPDEAKSEMKMTAAVFGGIDYNPDSTKIINWKYLPGTLIEKESIEKQFKKNNITCLSFSGKEAKEENFKALFDSTDAPSILHVSTHGFFYPDPESRVREKSGSGNSGNEIAFRGSNGFGLWMFVQNKNPMMRSGLVFAGANRVWSEDWGRTDNEGVLTAYEVSNMNMRNTDLVVLSACETGLGDIKGSEGVYGLQRAFKMAGVKYIIMSLWQVPDKETVEFMETFYKKLLKIKNVKTAFTETQKEMRKKYDPYYWAAFVLVE